MLLKVLDMIECPKCKGASRIWKISGDFSDIRVADGVVECPKGHKWQVREDILRMDKEESDEPMIFLDHDRTGYPKLVAEMERADFLAEFAGFCMDFQFDENALLKITGDPLLFFRYVENIKGEILVIHPNEGILRQLQVEAAKKQFYKEASFVRLDYVETLGNVKELRIFPSSVENLKSNDIVLQLIPKENSHNGIVLWSGKTHSLVKSII